MDSAFYEFVIPGMGAQCSFFQTQIKKNPIFPHGTRVKRDGKDLIFGATFRELLSEVHTAMNKFIYKLGSDTQVSLDSSQISFVKKNVKFNTQKNKHLEWIMPFGSKGIVYTMTYDAVNSCIIIGAFSYLHRLHFDMIEEAAHYKQQLIAAFDTEDKDLLEQIKGEIRRSKWPSCFDDIIIEGEDESSSTQEPEKEPAPVPVAMIATVSTTSIPFTATLETIHESAAEETVTTPAINTDSDRIIYCWACDHPMSTCKC